MGSGPVRPLIRILSVFLEVLPVWYPLKKLFRKILNIRLYLKDPEKSKFRKFLIIFGIIYLVSPLDLVPEPVFGAGILDDMLLWISLLIYLSDELDSYTGQEGISREARRRYRGTTVYETEARVIEEDDETMEGETEK